MESIKTILRQQERPSEFKRDWILIPPSLIADKRLSLSEKLLYGVILGSVNDYGYSMKTNEGIALIVGIPKNTVRNKLSKLYEKAYLRYELIKNDRGEVQERRIYPTLVPSTVLPPIPKSVLPHTEIGTEYVNNNNVLLNNVNVIENKTKKTRKEGEETDYYAQLIADKLGDRKSIAYYRQLCGKYSCELLYRKACEIIADGTARNPGAVFASWIKKQA